MSQNAASLRNDRSDGGGNKLAVVLGVLLALLLAAIALFFILGGEVDLDADADVAPPNVDVNAPDVDVEGGGVDISEGEANVDEDE